MAKMHLGAKAPNEGARLLARWIARETRGSTRMAARMLGTDESVVQRLIDGDLIPGDQLGEPLFRIVRVDRLMFQRPAQAAWFAEAQAA